MNEKVKRIFISIGLGLLSILFFILGRGTKRSGSSTSVSNTKGQRDKLSQLGDSVEVMADRIREKQRSNKELAERTRTARQIMEDAITRSKQG